MKLTLLIQGIDRITAPVRKIQQSVGGLGTRFTRTTGEASRAGRSLDAFGRAAGGAMRGIGALAGRVAHLAGQGGLLAVRKSATLARSALTGTLAMAGRLAIGTTLAGVAGAGLFAKSMIGLAGSFEQYQVQLEGLLGSEQKAKAAMAWVRNFAKDTPYDVDQVTEAFVRAKGVGIDPMSDAFRQMGDAASGSSKSLMDAVEAIADAQTGEFDRLKAFNITGSSSGSKATFSYLTKAGKSASKTVRKDMASIRDAVLTIFDERYGGGMVRQSKTLFGIWNNLKDLFSGFQLDIANAGFFAFLKQQLQELLTWSEKLAADGTLKRAAEETSKWLVANGKVVVSWLKGINLGEVREDIGNVAEAIFLLAKAITAAARAVQFMRRLKPIDDPYGMVGGIPAIGSKVVRWATGASGPEKAPSFSPNRPINWTARPPATAVGPSQSFMTVRIDAAPGLRASVPVMQSDSRTILRAGRGRSMGHVN